MKKAATTRTPTEREDVSARLAEQIPTILDVWEQRVRAMLPAVRDEEPPILRDHLPSLLLELAQALSPVGKGPDLPAELQVSKQHGEERARSPHYSLQQVLCEYRLLRKSILEVLEAQSPMAPSEREVITDTIERAMQDAGDQYVQVQQLALLASHERLVGLQHVTDAALAHLTLDALLQELLSRIRDLLATDIVAVLLLEGRSLVVTAATGFTEEVECRVRIPLGEGFSGRVAATGQPLLIEDALPGQIASPVLRARGIRSLLGVPLLVEGRVIGVLNVGSRQPRQFTQEDTRLLQLVADRVALGIDRARLFAEVQATNDRKSEFLAMMAHELRTPLSAISNALYLLENIDVSDPRAGRHLATMKRQACQLTRLVEDLMDISRIARGQTELRLEPLPIRPIAEEVTEALRPLADARGQELTCTVSAEHLLVNADPGRLEQILTNLLNNGIKYTEPGGRIWLAVDREGDHAVVRVTDTGIGIDPPMLPHVFDLFRQVERSALRSQGGLGIGLALVKRLVELHGGDVTAHSGGEGLGAQFVVRLPLVAATRTG